MKTVNEIIQQRIYNIELMGWGSVKIGLSIQIYEKINVYVWDMYGSFQKN